MAQQLLPTKASSHCGILRQSNPEGAVRLGEKGVTKLYFRDQS